MRLSAMAEQFHEQLRNEQFNELSFEDQLSLMADIEWSRRKNNKLDRNIKGANFRYPQACIEDIEYTKTDGSIRFKSSGLHLVIIFRGNTI
jgi:hypothetical protein